MNICEAYDLITINSNNLQQWRQLSSRENSTIKEYVFLRTIKISFFSPLLKTFLKVTGATVFHTVFETPEYLPSAPTRRAIPFQAVENNCVENPILLLPDTIQSV